MFSPELTLIIAMASTVSHIEHVPDKSIWPITEEIRWPGSSRSVSVFFESEASRQHCAEYTREIKEFFSSRDSRLAMGRACEDLVVLYNNPETEKLLDRRALSFIAAHEAYHLAFQYFGGKIEPELMDARRESLDDIEIDLFRMLESDARAWRAGNQANGEVCDRFQEIYSKLGPERQANIRFFAVFEWPAEYYAFATTFGSDLWAEYIRTRKTLGLHTAYRPGVHIVWALVQKFGRRVVVRNVMEGKDVLNQYLEMRGCRDVPKAGLLGRVTDKPLF